MSLNKRNRRPYSERRHGLQLVTLCISTTMVLVLLGIVVLSVLTARNLQRSIKENVEISVILGDTVSVADGKALGKTIERREYARQVSYISREAALEMAKAEMGIDPSEFAGGNPFSSELTVKIDAAYANTDSLAKISRELKKNEIVQDVDYPDYIVKTVSNNFRKIQWIILGVCTVFVLISMLLIANCIRLNIYAKRFNIKSMLLVGATPKFVRAPFVAKGFVQGIWGGIIAILLLATMLYFGNQHMPEFIDFSQMLYIAIILGGVLIFSILFTMLISSFSVRRYVRIKDERLYL